MGGVSIATTCFIDAISPIGNFGFWLYSGFNRWCDRSCSQNMKKTHFMLQEDYEQSYLGPEFQIENRYAKLIAMFYIVMMYSAAMPVLYLAGFFLMIVSYWADKVLFLRHYRLPPRWGRGLARRVAYIMQFAIFLHLFFGLHMLSNPEIFTYENEELEVPRWCKVYIKIFSRGAEVLLGYDPERLNQVHTLIYCLGIGFFTALFIIESLLNFFSLPGLTVALGKLYYACNDK